MKSFEQLKSNLLHAPILAYPRFKPEHLFILDTDWSQENRAVKAVLSQFQSGKERVITYGASKLTVAQSAYHSTKGEMAAAIIYIRKWKYYLQHRRFILRIDYAAMQWIHTLVEPVQGMVQRWLQTLANNEFDVVHRLGRNHGNADALSRAPHLIEDPSFEFDISMGEEIGAVICSLQEEEPWTPDLVCEGQEQDEELAEVRKWVSEQTKATNSQQSALTAEGKKLASLFDSLYLDKDRVLCYDFTYGQEMGLPEVRHLIVLPESMCRGAIEHAHHAVAHKAVEATVAELHKNVYFAGMYRWVNETLRRCETCQVKKGLIPNQRGLLVSHATGYLFQKISIDFVGPLPRLKKGNEYMLTDSDCFTRWLEAFPCRRANAQLVVDKLITEIFPRFGVCDQIHSDRGTQFLSDLVSEVVAALGIRQS
jgi:hypothetical protein